jgi:hypothetical protein
MGGSTGGRRARGGVGEHGGARGPPDGQVSLLSAHGVHAAAGVCCGRGAGAQKREAGCG